MTPMNKTYYICKYTPVELLTALGADCANLTDMPEGTALADEVMGPNLCGFGKTLLEAALSGDIRELVLVNCCDTIRSVYDVLAASGKLDFLYLLDILREGSSCSVERTAEELKHLKNAYAAYRGTSFDPDVFRSCFHPAERKSGPYLSVMGARMGRQLFETVEELMPLPVRNDTCVHNRSAGNAIPPEDGTEDELLLWYAGELLHQLPCLRMRDRTGRKQLTDDPDLRGILYHTIQFCDFYGFEYSDLLETADVPLLKLESDYTLQSRGQILTRLEAFAEGLAPERPTEEKTMNANTNAGYVAGIDSGSTSTDAVILDRNRNLVASVILPTGAGASISAEQALEAVLTQASLTSEDLASTVATGYGRAAIEAGDKSITEISCHARGARFLEPTVRTVIDIGGQDSKVIVLDDEGGVKNFAMNDKCAAGTGRFLEMVGRTLGLSLEELSEHGLHHNETITISSTCTVFAESEIVSLVAQNKDLDDIIYGLDRSVASKTLSLVRRVGGCPAFMMTGGVAQNRGLVRALEELLGETLIIREEAQLCGAIGAALYALDLT